MNAIEAKFEAQKLSFAPLVFQALRALYESGALRAVSGSGEAGISAAGLARSCALSPYAVRLLADIALETGVFEAVPAGAEGGGASGKSGTEGAEQRFSLGKTGYFLLEDPMTRANFDFVQDVCYQGAFSLPDALRDGRPAGLAVFGGRHGTIYEALATLPERARQSWFAFDHYYSDGAFPAALPLVFESPRRLILDIGGNTAKWAVACCAYDRAVNVIIADLPGQAALAEKNAAAAGYAGRIRARSCNILDEEAALPAGADAVWMSQFLDCFSLDEVTGILKKVARAVDERAVVYVLEPLIDKQRYPAASYSLRAASLYFACMANGNSRFFYYDELRAAVCRAGFAPAGEWHDLGPNSYSLLRFRKIP